MAGSEDGGALGGQTKNIPPKTDGAQPLIRSRFFDGRHHEHWMWLGLGADLCRIRKVSPITHPLANERFLGKGSWG